MKKSIISALTMVAGGIIGASAVGKIRNDKAEKIQEKSNKHLALFLMMNDWVKVKQEGKNLSSYFKKHRYERIAVYGMSYVGETLVNELMDSEIELVYGIDQRDGLYSYINILSVDSSLPEVDAIVVTAITFFDEIEKVLRDKVSCPIISLASVLDDM
ncbi:MAG: hypothetical protein OSJ53_02790 [Kineothrix sp.]|nr:hypothetical protein [Kineothrix sp.]